MEIRTRFAPSPTGFMHIGNLRTAIFEYLVAKKNNGKFILRVEDTDQSRKVAGAIDFIYDTLKLCNMEIDEGPNNKGKYGPYIQSERIKIYQEYAHKLVELGGAYYCFCTEDRLESLRCVADSKKVPFMYDGLCREIPLEEAKVRVANGEKYVIRQKMPKTGYTSYDDMVYGNITIENSVLEDQILLKSDGYPTYNFANVIDDHLMGITHVIRGNEYLAQTPKYNLLYDAYGFDKPVYIHVPMVLGSDGNKLSKRNGDASFMDLYNEGYLPEAIVNYLVLLGWSPLNNKEIFTMDELTLEFDPKRISKSPAIYDIKKLQWINAHYIKNLSIEELKAITLSHLEKSYNLVNIDSKWIDDLIGLYQNEIKYGMEIVELTKMFFEDCSTISDEATELMKEESVSNTLSIFREEINSIKEWDVLNVTNAINNTKEKALVKGKMLYMPIRIKVSGLMHGPDLANVIYLFGKSKVLDKLNN